MDLTSHTRELNRLYSKRLRHRKKEGMKHPDPRIQNVGFRVLGKGVTEIKALLSFQTIRKRDAKIDTTSIIVKEDTKLKVVEKSFQLLDRFGDTYLRSTVTGDELSKALDSLD